MSCSVGHSEMLLSVQMPTEHIVAMLIQERDKLNRAIEALTGSVKRRGRPPVTASPTTATAVPQKRKGCPPMSAAEKKAASQRMKAFWAAKRKGKLAK